MDSFGVPPKRLKTALPTAWFFSFAVGKWGVCWEGMLHEFVRKFTVFFAPGLHQCPDLLEGFFLDLPDPFAGDPQEVSGLFQGPGKILVETESHEDDLLLLFIEGPDEFLELVGDQDIEY